MSIQVILNQTLNQLTSTILHHSNHFNHNTSELTLMKDMGKIVDTNHWGNLVHVMAHVNKWLRAEQVDQPSKALAKSGKNSPCVVWRNGQKILAHRQTV